MAIEVAWMTVSTSQISRQNGNSPHDVAVQLVNFSMQMMHCLFPIFCGPSSCSDCCCLMASRCCCCRGSSSADSASSFARSISSILSVDILRRLGARPASASASSADLFRRRDCCEDVAWVAAARSTAPDPRRLRLPVFRALVAVGMSESSDSLDESSRLTNSPPDAFD